MVNRAVVGLLLGVVVIAVMVAGAVVVLVSPGSSGAGTPTPTDVQSTPLGSGTDAPSPTPAPEGTRTPTAAEATTVTGRTTTAVRTTIAADEFQPGAIEAEIRTLINDRREARGLEPLRDDTEPVKKLNPMARDHSAEMARVDDARHTIDERSTGDRYRQYDLYGTCKWRAADGDYVIRPDNPRKTQLEAVGTKMAGRPYSVGGERQFNGNESQVARALVGDWFDGYPDESKFYLEEASQAGVGVHVTLSGEVYATVALC